MLSGWQGSTNLNHDKVPLHTDGRAKINMTDDTKCWWEYGVTGTHTAGSSSIKWNNLFWHSSDSVLNSWTSILLYDLTFPLLGINAKEMKICPWKNNS